MKTRSAAPKQSKSQWPAMASGNCAASWDCWRAHQAQSQLPLLTPTTHAWHKVCRWPKQRRCEGDRTLAPGFWSGIKHLLQRVVAGGHNDGPGAIWNGFPAPDNHLRRHMCTALLPSADTDLHPIQQSQMLAQLQQLRRIMPRSAWELIGFNA